MGVRRIAGDGVELLVLDEGAGAPVLLLHGWPDSSHLWRHQVPALVDAGLHVIAPDMRGFGQSDRPQDVDAYRVRHAVADAVAVLDAFGAERAHVVGHDWGAAVAWGLAAFAPERVERLVAMSVGHPMAFRGAPIEAREKGWYRLLFQFEEAEELLRRNDWSLLRQLLRDGGDLDRYVADLARPGALTASLGWYRANLHPRRELEPGPRVPAVQAPTLGLWSSGDHYLLEQPMQRSGEHVTGSWRYERIDGASHWMQLDRPQQVNALLREFLA